MPRRTPGATVRFSHARSTSRTPVAGGLLSRPFFPHVLAVCCSRSIACSEVPVSPSIDSSPAVPAVEVHGLRKEFRRRSRVAGGRRFGRTTRRAAPALQDVTFTVQRGECVAILGQNGSGKSTLVRLLSTLLLHDGGTARVFGHDVFTDERAVRRLVNRVSVEASFFKKMSAAENLGYAARFYGLTARDTRDEIPRILERVGFPPERRGEPMENLSRGYAAEGGARPRAADEPGAAPARRADDGARSALEAGGAGVHPRSARRTRRDDPPLYARPCRGRGARRQDRRAAPWRAALARARRGAEAPLRRGDARGGVLRRDGADVRGRGRRQTTSGRCSPDARDRGSPCARS